MTSRSFPRRGPLRPGRVVRRLRLAAAAVLVLSLLAGCGVVLDPGDPRARTDAPAVAEASDATATPPTAGLADEPVPAWALNLVGQLECDEPPQAIGYERGGGPRVGHEGTASPGSWLEQLDSVDLPFSGWREEPRTSWHNGVSHFMRSVNEVDGRVKAIILMEGTSVDGGPGAWDVTAFRACQPAEFDPRRGRTTDDAGWHDADGQPTSDVRTSIGPAHCGWESSTWLHLDGDLFIRDPLGLFVGRTVAPYHPDVEAESPPTLAATGYRSVRWELLVAEDPDNVYVRADGGVLERWPRVADQGIGCA